MSDKQISPSDSTDRCGRKSGRIRRRRGTVTVEMAMITPVVFMIFFGSVEFSRLMMVRQALTNSAREGCRNACLATTRDSDDSEAVIRESLSAVIGDVSQEGPLNIQFSPDFDVAPPSGTSISATVEIDFEDVSWLPPFFTAGAKIRGTALMNRE